MIVAPPVILVGDCLPVVLLGIQAGDGFAERHSLFLTALPGFAKVLMQVLVGAFGPLPRPPAMYPRRGVVVCGSADDRRSQRHEGEEDRSEHHVIAKEGSERAAGQIEFPRGR